MLLLTNLGNKSETPSQEKKKKKERKKMRTITTEDRNYASLNPQIKVIPNVLVFIGHSIRRAVKSMKKIEPSLTEVGWGELG